MSAECSNFTVEFVHVLLLRPCMPKIAFKKVQDNYIPAAAHQEQHNSGQQMPQLNAHRGPVCVAESSTSTCKRCEEE